MILLDSDIIIAHLKGNKHVTTCIQDQLADIAVPAVVLAELDYGAKASKRRDENIRRLYDFVQALPIIPFDIQCAHEHGTLKAELRKIGRPSGAIDGLIAATALANNAILCTHNTSHFENIPDLNLIDWLA